MLIFCQHQHFIIIDCKYSQLTKNKFLSPRRRLRTHTDTAFNSFLLHFMKLYCNFRTWIERHILQGSSVMYNAWNTSIIMMLIMFPDVRGKGDFFLFVTSVNCNFLFNCLHLSVFILSLVFCECMRYLKRTLLSMWYRFHFQFVFFQWCADQPLRPVYCQLVIFLFQCCQRLRHCT